MGGAVGRAKRDRARVAVAPFGAGGAPPAEAQRVAIFCLFCAAPGIMRLEK